VGFFMQHDVLIVGFGLAGWALTEDLKQEGKSFVAFDAEKKSSSSVATGI
jgi:cation diffusion facilitator CzcD-associated flavoprotein CzcO